MKFAALFLSLLVASIAFAADTNSIYHGGWIDLDKNGTEDVYEDPSQPVAKRVDNLLKRMTLDEKIGQLEQSPFRNDPVKQLAGKLQAGEISSFLVGSALIETPILRN